MTVKIIPIVFGAFATVTKGTWKLADEWRPSKQPEYCEESGRQVKTCCLSNSCERPSANMKTSQEEEEEEEEEEEDHQQEQEQEK